MSCSVEEVKTPGQWRAFNSLAASVYAGDRYYTPEPAVMMPDQEGRVFLVYDDGKPRARCCARLQSGNPGIGTIGRFEAFNDRNAATELLQVAVQALKQQGVQRIIGPMEGDTWHTYRLNMGPYSQPPFVKEPWNPPYYPELWQDAGFKIVEAYDSFIVDDPALAASHQAKYLERCRRNGYSFSEMTPSSYEALLPLIYELSCAIFSQNVLYTPISFESFRSLYAPAKKLLQPGLCWVAKRSDQKPVGFVFTFPDYAEAMRSMAGRTDLCAKIRFLLKRGKATRTCIKTLGILPEARGTGLSNALMGLCFEATVRLGYEKALMCLMHSANPSRRLGGEADRPFRSYALFEYVS